MVGGGATVGVMQRTVLQGLSVRLSVKRVDCVTKRKKIVPTFLYHMKDHSSWFSEKKNGWFGRSLLPEIFGQTDPVGAKAVTLSEKSSTNTNSVFQSA